VEVYTKNYIFMTENIGMNPKYKFPAIAFLIVTAILVPVHTQVSRPMLMLERWLPGYGWIEILLLGIYAGFIVYKMLYTEDTALWRLRIWLLFSVVFFGQLILGLSGLEIFLMTGNLHFPIPAVILAGPIYRLEIGFMPILFVSTLILSGPAWCAQLCYFGALDGLASTFKKPKPLVNKKQIRWTLLFLVILTAILLRVFQTAPVWVMALTAGFGITGLLVILLRSRNRGLMSHCTEYCPVGVLVSYLKFVNPFRVVICEDCTLCKLCFLHCPYDALTMEDLRKGSPGITCSYCGDCMKSCKRDYIQYKLFNMDPALAKKIWFVLTVSLHAVFLGLARI
jgi:ferredoxin-type protein NapH